MWPCGPRNSAYSKYVRTPSWAAADRTSNVLGVMTHCELRVHLEKARVLWWW